MSAPASCPRCGAERPTIEQLAAIAMRADAALRERHLAVPDVTSQGLHLLARALRCHAALCGGSEVA